MIHRIPSEVSATSHEHHHHAPQNFGARFALGIGLNLAFVAIEAFFGWQAHSLALLADAGHNLGDVAGLALAWAGLAAGRLRANDRHSYGCNAPPFWRVL
ncbi:MAG: cation transporter [Halothiobacillus sp.]